MTKILIFGAGRSAWYTIEYLFTRQQRHGWQVTVADGSETGLETCKRDFQGIDTRLVDVLDDNERIRLVYEHDIVISLLPAQFHILVARDCLSHGAHLITPSYVIPEISALDEEVKKKGLIFINELGLDPGIDHMSAMEVIQRLKDNGAHIRSFRSYCGGLIAKDFDDNPWHYKFTWNPYNVVRAGQDGGLSLRHGRYKYLPYTRLFSEAGAVTLPDGEVFDAYLNRNSIPYIEYYGLEEVETFERGTLRYAGFCRKWEYLVNAGLTTDKVVTNNQEVKNWPQYLKSFLPEADTWQEGFERLQNHELFEEDRHALEWLFENAQLLPGHATPAQGLQFLLESKWDMKTTQTDRIVMVHELEYELKGKHYLHHSHLDLNGDDEKRTAMAKTVGLPLAIAAQLVAEKAISKKGVVLPVEPQLYVPELRALKELGIHFAEQTKEL